MKNEILNPVLSTDETAVPRFDILSADGQVLFQNVTLQLKNEIAQVGTPFDKAHVLTDETAAALLLQEEDPNINDAFNAIGQKTGNLELRMPKYEVITLTASEWDSSTLTQTVTVAGVSAVETDQIITPTPALINQAAYYDAGVKGTAQAADSLTFTADKLPTDDLTVYVIIQEVNAE